MAEVAIVLSVIKLLVESTPLIDNEVRRHQKIPNDLKAIQDELRSICACLRIAEKRPNRNDVVNEWIRQVRILSFDIQDIIEEHHLCQRHGRLYRFWSQSSRNLEDNIGSIRERAKDIYARRIAYDDNDYVRDIAEIRSSTEDIPAMVSCSSIGNEGDFVGASSSKNDLMTLLNLNQLNSGFSTISIVGPRGVGKTSLVRSIFHDDCVRDYFVTRAWINVSQFRSYVGILISMIIQFHEADIEHHQLLDFVRGVQEVNGSNSSNSSNNKRDSVNIADLQNTDEESLKCRIPSFLENKRYMIVFDDVEEKFMPLVENVKSLLRGFKNNQGSKVLVTTCYENVARRLLNGQPIQGPYQLKPLSPEDALNLFCNKAFQNHGRHCPQWLEAIAQEIVKDCGGLPSKLREMGEVLSNKKLDIHEWQKVSQNPGFYLTPHASARTKLLQTYYDLSPELKLCLLYFGMFPYNYAVRRMRVIRLWIAEGFVSKKIGTHNLTLEEIAEEYIEQLSNKRLVEVKHKDHTGKPKILGISHKDLYDMIVSKVDESSFCRILSARNSNVDDVTRRLSIHEDHKPAAYEILDNIAQNKSKVRCFLSLNNSSQDIITRKLSKAFLRNLSLLKILDLQDAPIVYLPKAIGELLNLTYLSLKSTKVRILPKSITKLQSLQTLDLKHTLIEELPKDINLLVNLRHLLAYRFQYDVSHSYHVSRTIGVKLTKGASLSGFTNLQQLAFLDVSHTRLTVVQELIHLKQLRKLGIIGIGMDNEKQICDAIQNMVNLEALSVYSYDMTINLEYITSPPHLKRLYLNGRIMRLPSWIVKPCSLVKLRLRWSKLQADPLKTLQVLPNLVELQLLDAYEGTSIHIKNKWFPKLKVLNLLDLHNLESLSFSPGALPLLKEMSIGESKRLNLPYGIEHLTNLNKLVFFDMPSHFIDNMQQGELFHQTLMRIAEVFSYAKTSTGWICIFTRSKNH